MRSNRLDPGELTYRLRDLKQAHPRLKLLEKSRPELVAELTRVQKHAREFGERFIAPAALEVDRRVERDHGYFHWDFVRDACKYRFLSYFIPKPFGGMGYYTTHFAILMEELCSFCPGVANVFGAHALGISPLLMSPDIRLFERYLRPVAESEKAGRPIIFALAITEPGAGSDVEDADMVGSARLCTFAKKVKGGYVLNGRKVFISNGSIARYTWVSAVLDRSRPAESVVSFVVPNDARGFSVGTIEKKMGQRACPASELVFDDVFVPVEDRVGDEGAGERLVASVLGGSRAPVAAIATGIARGAFQALLKYLNEKKTGGRRLFDEQWVQIALAEMMTKIQAARQLYLDASMTCDAFGMPRLLGHPSMKLLDMIPKPLMRTGIPGEIIQSKAMYEIVKDLAAKTVSDETIDYIAGLSSIAKYTAGDIAVEVTSRAMEVMGLDGPAAEYGVEKFYRDAKLTQIYEGTNQINRLYAFKKLLA